MELGSIAMGLGATKRGRGDFGFTVAFNIFMCPCELVGNFMLPVEPISKSSFLGSNGTPSENLWRLRQQCGPVMA
jgi:hypothetical protein